MDRASIIRKLIERIASDFLSYFKGTPLESDAERIIAAAVGGLSSLSQDRDLLEWMLPDTENDGRFEASFALNAGSMVLSLIDYVNTRDEAHYRDAVTFFFDTIDFKIHEELENAGIATPLEQQIASHPLFVQERRWFASVESAA